MSTVLGFFSFLFIFVQLCLAIQASNYGFGLVSVEESELTADFLLTKPVSRGAGAHQQNAGGAAACCITDVVVWAGSLLAIALFNDGQNYDCGHSGAAAGQHAGLPALLPVRGAGHFAAGQARAQRHPYALGLAFGAYVLSAFSGVFGDVALEYITPFKHFDAGYIVPARGYNTPLVLLNVGVTVVALAASYWLLPAPRHPGGIVRRRLYEYLFA